MSSPVMVWKEGDSRSLIHTFTSEEVEAFARLSGDHNPLHVDTEYANRTAAGGPVVHGMLAASFISTLIGMHVPGPGALWNSFHIDWRKMIRINDTLKLVATVKKVHHSSGILDLQVDGHNVETGETYFHATASVMLMTVKKKNDSNGQAGLILITGASGVLGSAIAKELSKAGFRMVLWGRDRERLQRVAEYCDHAVEGIHSVDFNSADETAKACAELRATGEFGGLVFAAAPMLRLVGIDEPDSVKLLREHWQAGPTALLSLISAVTPAMSQGGFITAVLTQAVFDAPPPKYSQYLAAKMAMWSLIRSAATELGPRGIRCNAVSPGLMETPYVKDVPVRVKQIEAATNPLRRLCQVEDVAHMVAFLASANAGFINGANIPVTGGQRMP